MATADKEDHYNTIARAIAYLQAHFREQPGLEALAAHVQLSPFHFQRIFTSWAGVSPKKFARYLTVEYAKELLLQDKKVSLFATALESGLSGSGRLHDLFVNIEGMTPGEYRNGGQALTISYSLAQSPFGNILIASTPKGICHLQFMQDEEEALAGLRASYPRATCVRQANAMHTAALGIFQPGLADPEKIRLHIKGTPFQLKVWQALLHIPAGGLATYARVAAAAGHGKASRSAGSAIGDNPVAYIIPCHRVILSSGQMNRYRWGSARKAAIIGWEAAHLQPDPAGI